MADEGSLPWCPVRDHDHDPVEVDVRRGELVTTVVYECAAEDCGWKRWVAEDRQTTLTSHGQ